MLGVRSQAKNGFAKWSRQRASAVSGERRKHRLTSSTKLDHERSGYGGHPGLETVPQVGAVFTMAIGVRGEQGRLSAHSDRGPESRRTSEIIHRWTR